MLKSIAALVFATLFAGSAGAGEEMEHHHDHPAPEKLGSVTFATSCDPQIATKFDRAMALLHSFAYSLSRRAFANVANSDPHCAMAFWGEAMTHYHQLWEPNVDSEGELGDGAEEVRRAAMIGSAASPRERQYIEAIGSYYLDWPTTAASVRAQRYAAAMAELAKTNPTDDEAQIFYALSLLATASPFDKTHANQKLAAAILEPLWKLEPQHPGIAHYLIHAYDSTELAQRGLAPARAYSKIAPSAPHALHMPSHIFTRLGLWQESVISNLAARAAARAQGDIGEELHAMDYLTYAYLQLGHYDDAANVVAAVRTMSTLPVGQFKVGYAANAMQVRLAVETRDWNSATQLSPLPGSTPKVAAIVYWARALGHARATPATAPDSDITALTTCLGKLRAAGDIYWSDETDALLKSARAWAMQGSGDSLGAISNLKAAAADCAGARAVGRVIAGAASCV